MDYVVKHYIPLKGELLTPGEIVSDFPEEIIPRLLEKGAIEEIAPVSPAEGRKDAKPRKAAEKVSEPVTAEEEEPEIEEEAPVIDPMDAVVAAPAEEAPKKTSRKRTAKKEG